MSEKKSLATASAQVELLPKVADGVVRVLDGAEAGHTRQLGHTPLVIGTSAEADLKLPDRGVSRRHCQISLAARGFMVKDLGSRNGTFFEGSQVGEMAVFPGAIIRVGNTHLTVGVDPQSSKLPLSSASSFGNAVGKSIAMRRVFGLCERVATSDATVLLGGETGTGKEVVAQGIHAHGPRAKKPFEVFDCGAVAPSLFASELFGHVKGSFTGAIRDHAGAIERAQGGTLFLDEIGELPLELQPALLRVVERKTLQRVGATLPTEVDVRIIAATRRDLAAEVVAGRFREDLYYRLNVLHVTLPALRNHREDLPLLCQTLLKSLGYQSGPVEGAGLVQLAAHDWPGNVRELRNVLERAVMGHPKRFPFSELTFHLDKPRGEESQDPKTLTFGELKKQAAERFERQYLTELIQAHNGNLRAAARASGIERMHLKRTLRKHRLI